MNNNTNFFLCALIIAVTLLSAGCINIPSTSPHEKYIFGMYTTCPLNQSEVKAIEYEKVKTNIESNGYEWRNNSLGESITYTASIRAPNLSRNSLTMNIHNDNNSARLYVDYSLENSFPESNLTEKKQYLKERVDEIVTICNLTVNTTNIQWQISYAD